MKLVESELA